MTIAETQRVDKLRVAGKTPLEVLVLLNRSRALRDIAPVSRTAMYDYCAGNTHQRDRPEKRGRRAVPMRKLKVYDAARKRLQKTVDNEHLVTWEDIAEAGAKDLKRKKLLKRGESGLSAERLRRRLGAELNVSRRRAPTHAALTDDDARRRLRQAERWVKHSAS